MSLYLSFLNCEVKKEKKRDVNSLTNKSEMMIVVKTQVTLNFFISQISAGSTN